MNTEHNSYNGFYNDPKYPQGFRLIRVNQDASVTIYGKDSQNEKVWCISGTLNDDNTIVLNDTSENPAFDKYNATLEDGRLLWFNSEKNQPESQWEKKKLTQVTSTNPVIERQHPGKTYTYLDKAKIALYRKIESNLRYPETIVSQSASWHTNVSNVPYTASVIDGVLLVMSLLACVISRSFI